MNGVPASEFQSGYLKLMGIYFLFEFEDTYLNELEPWRPQCNGVTHTALSALSSSPYPVSDGSRFLDFAHCLGAEI